MDVDVIGGFGAQKTRELHADKNIYNVCEAHTIQNVPF